MLSITCPECGYQGEPKIEAKRSNFLFGLFIGLGVVPGIIYYVITPGNRFKCPKCGTQVAEN
jgi:ssDNA-binding Zn-finger/Zn-ribbon topoisomerase 1